MNVNRLNVVTAGMVTSVGMDAPSTAAAIRAGLDNFQLSEFRDTTNEPIVVAPVKITSIETATEYRQGGYEHFSRMCTLAIEECAIKAGLSLPLPTDIAIFILGDDTRPKPITTIIHTLLHDDSLFHQSEQRHIQAFTHGESSCIYALAAANNYLTNNSYAILLAADSWLNTTDIESNLHLNRINTSESAGGFIPGEAAAACLLTRTIPHTHQLSVLGLACAEEQASLLSDQPVYGVGLAAAMKAAIALNSGVDIQIEVENMSELQEALSAGAKSILIDNFSLDQMREAVAVTKGAALLEASGGVSLDQLKHIAATGVDRISIGKLTKDVIAVDFSLRVQ